MSDKKLYGMAENNTWNSAVTLARNEHPNVNMGFARKGTPLYERAKEIQLGMAVSMGGGSPVKAKKRAPKASKAETPRAQPQQPLSPMHMYEDHRNGGLNENRQGGLNENRQVGLNETRVAGGAKPSPFKGFKVRLGGGVAETAAPKMISVSSFRDYFASRK